MSKSAIGKFLCDMRDVSSSLTADELLEWADEMVTAEGEQEMADTGKIEKAVGSRTLADFLNLRGREEFDLATLANLYDRFLADILELMKQAGRSTGDAGRIFRLDFVDCMFRFGYIAALGVMMASVGNVGEAKGRLIDQTLRLFEQRPEIVKGIITAVINDAQIQFLVSSYNQRAKEIADA